MRNRKSGTVAGIIQGPQDAVEEMKLWLSRTGYVQTHSPIWINVYLVIEDLHLNPGRRNAELTRPSFLRKKIGKNMKTSKDCQRQISEDSQVTIIIETIAIQARTLQLLKDISALQHDNTSAIKIIQLQRQISRARTVSTDFVIASRMTLRIQQIHEIEYSSHHSSFTAGVVFAIDHLFYLVQHMLHSPVRVGIGVSMPLALSQRRLYKGG